MLLEIYACLEFCVNSERARSYKSRRTFPLDFIKVKRYSILKYGKLFFKIAFKILDRIRLGSEASFIVHHKARRALYRTVYISANIGAKRKNCEIQYVFYCTVNLLYFNYSMMHNRDRAENIPE